MRLCLLLLLMSTWPSLDIIETGFPSSSDIDTEQTDCLSPTVAEKILGQTAKRVENSKDIKDGIVSSRCTYSAVEEDPKTHQFGNVYYVFEEHTDVKSAHRSYDYIIQQNRNNPGQEKLANIGDEAWFHSDKENFYLIMFRKGNKIARIKVNKVTSKTSLQELKNAAIQLAAAIE